MRRLGLTKEWLETEYVDKQRTAVDIANEVGCHPQSVKRLLRHHGIKLRGNGHKLIDLRGQTFDRLTVEERAEGSSRQGARWRCRCVCGKSVVVVSRSLRKVTRSCGCLKFDKTFKGRGRLSATYWNHIVKGAEARGLLVEVTLADAWRLFLAQGAKCALSGQPIEIVTDYTGRHHLHTASLDRKDRRVGYTLENIQWVHRDVNIMKNRFDEAYFVDTCRRIVGQHDSREKNP